MTAPAETALRPLIAVAGVSKAYPGTQALSNIDLHIMPGEIHGIAGQNGAGKSTLVRILSGVEKPDSGTVLLDGAPVSFDNPHAAQRARIMTVHQELSLMPHLSVAENIYVGELPRTVLGTVDWRTVRSRAREQLLRLGFDLDVRASVGSLPIAHRQAVEIAKAVSGNARVLILDEPTATLPRHDVRQLFDLLNQLKKLGIAIIYISHHFDEMYEICDKISVFRDGRRVAVHEADASRHDLILQAMLGGVSTEQSAKLQLGSSETPRLGVGRTTGEVALAVRGLRDGHDLHGIDLTLHRGEVLGVAGLSGNGQSQLAAALFGAEKSTQQSFEINGRKRHTADPAESIRLGLGLLPEERKAQGLALTMSVTENITMASLAKFSPGFFLNRGSEHRAALRMRDALAIKVASVRQPVGNLSGGNQQKVALAKWLVSGVKTLIIVEPTRGVDVGAKLEIYELIRQFVEDGGSVIVITSEIDEALMCDRVLILSRGRISGTVDRAEIDEHGEAAVLNRFN
ncbi:monosaccharide ABC transporter ATP-binding protein, CUT2 family [Arthrobacter sp. ok909]|uniref:sugar ABC transporter ATP-binding protein n=1 Tax=Arthrobacter sp. ok909 TaxID=1761746 RepID=UPI00088D4069|nr:sugar ABC transporter ATP-binding protein [Arthrobacter sp. ok909]SDP43152.1 monosaccharide ABC transporter ATP-binding protein, CUT2 family [Arthrobacter sp. ok909]